MKKFLFFVLIGFATINAYSQAIIADHTKAKLEPITESAILKAKADLHIAYGHTSHGSQILTGMTNLVGKTNLIGYKGDIYRWKDGPEAGKLDIDDNFVSGDLADPDRVTWESLTRTYLNDPANSDVNVVMWSWCSQVSSSTEDNINTYLNLMQGLETDYPDVKFVYMTGHVDGTGITGNLHLRNQQIRQFCNDHNKILYDFADIESYDPDGNYYLDKGTNDTCGYDSNADGVIDKNWAIDWQNSHTVDVYWYKCNPNHTKALNGNLKAYAAWWLWAKLADGSLTSTQEISKDDNKMIKVNNYPNPSSVSTKLVFELPGQSNVILKLFRQSGSEVMNIPIGQRSKGINEYELNTSNLTNGLYFYKICSDKQEITKKLIKQ